MKGHFVQSLANMIALTSRSTFRRDASEIKVELQTFWIGVDIAFGREMLVDQATAWQAEYILWLDDDHVFPPDALIRLLTLNLPFVAAIARIRVDGDVETVFSNAFQGDRMVIPAADGGVEEVDAVGLGICLMRTAALHGIQRPFFQFDTASMVGEDIYFCRKLRAAGVKLHVDHSLSREVGHIAETVLTFAR